MTCHLAFVRRAKAGLGTLWNDPEVGRKTLLMIPVIAAMLVAGWYAIRRRVEKTADQELTRITR